MLRIIADGSPHCKRVEFARRAKIFLSCGCRQAAYVGDALQSGFSAKSVKSAAKPRKTVLSEWLVCRANFCRNGKNLLLLAADFTDVADEDQRTQTAESAVTNHYSQILIEDRDPVVAAIATSRRPHESHHQRVRRSKSSVPLPNWPMKWV